jgi:hypothetical protein
MLPAPPEVSLAVVAGPSRRYSCSCEHVVISSTPMSDHMAMEFMVGIVTLIKNTSQCFFSACLLGAVSRIVTYGRSCTYASTWCNISTVRFT